MKQKCKLLFIVVLCCFYFIPLKGQVTIPAAGGNASGSGGTVSYTVGQKVYSSFSGSNGSVTQGVQQPYEISVVTALESAKEITLECTVYPNPTDGLIKLIVKSFDLKNLRFQLFDLNGLLLQDRKVENDVTEVSMGMLPASIYILKVINNNQEVKVFKIIKK
jgi:hypothetical protein